MSVRHLRMVIFVALMIVIGGWGLGLLPAPGQGQQQQDPNCPQAGCPEKPKHDPPPGNKWFMVIVHVGKGKVSCDPKMNPVADATVFLLDLQTQTRNPLLPGSQKPENGQTDDAGRYAAYVALPEADWKHVDVLVEKTGLKLVGVAGKIKYGLVGGFVLPETRLMATACMDVDPDAGRRLKLTLWPRPGVPTQGELPLPSTHQAAVGGWMCVNLDNDDRDANFDLKQQNVNGEDDLVQLIIEKFAGPPNATVQLRANKGANNIKLWDSPTKNKQVNLPVQFNMNALPQTLWIEGVKGSTAPRDVELELVPAGGWGNQALKGDKVALTVIAVEKMEWAPQGNNLSGKAAFDTNPNNPNTDLNRHPSGTFGLRVFPEALKPGEPARDRVTLKVILSIAPKPGVPSPGVPSDFQLYLRAFDVDDPSASGGYLDPNDDTAAKPGIYSNSTISYTIHEDNRGQVANFKAGQFLTTLFDRPTGQYKDNPAVQVTTANASPEAGGISYSLATLTFRAGQWNQALDFQVTKQPGDNFRVLASCDPPPADPAKDPPDFLADAVNQDNQGHGLDIRIATAQAGAAPLTLLPEHNSWQSEVLTVWRRLHIERDSMQAPPNRPQACPGGWMVNMNTVCGTITNVAPGPQANQSLVTTDQFLEDVNQYENGLLRLGPPPARQFNTLGNTAGTNATVTVQNDAQGAPPVNQPFDLHDDDNDTVLPRLPDLGWMQDSDNPQQNLFAMAYIRTTDDGGGGKTGEQNFPFDANTEDDKEALNESYYTKRQSTNSNSNDYWVVYLLSVFQGPVFRDGDPDNQPARLGVCSFVGQAPGALCGNVLLFYVEAYRDACGGLNAQAGVRSGLQATVVHEVGHSFGADLFHTEGGIMASGVEACLKSNPRFTEITLNRIRSARRPGGGAF